MRAFLVLSAYLILSMILCGLWIAFMLNFWGGNNPLAGALLIMSGIIIYGCLTAPPIVEVMDCD